MFVLGLWQALAGISAVVRNGLYVTAPGYIYSFDIAVWGWMILLLGVLTAGAGVAVLQGRTWADITAIVLVSLSLVVNFLLIPHYPIWSLLIIALDVLVIWSLTTQQRTVT
jgi:hypothetical protein